MKTVLATFCLFPAAWAQQLDCDLGQYKPQEGLRAEVRGGSLQVSWHGERGQQLRAALTIRDGQPVLSELAARGASGNWITLGRDLAPEFRVTSGVRRISNQQLQPLRALKVEITPDVIEREKWKVFWDAPLQVPGSASTNPGLPRKPEEIRRASASFRASRCTVRTDGARLEVEVPGLEVGIFAGSLQFTIYRGTNLLRMEAVARTKEPSVAYKYEGGLKGFVITEGSRVVWRDVARAWQHYAFGGAANTDPVGLRARNRLAIIESNGGSLAVFPPPHKFFFAREIELNLGYAYYRKDGESTFAVGVRQPDSEEMYRPYGVSDELWRRRVSQSRNFVNNFALYNAPAGTLQRMPVYFYLSAEDSRATQQAVLAFTHEDRYKSLAGYQVAASHFHTHFNEQLADAGTHDYEPTWLPVFRDLGINVAMMSDFHSDSHPRDPGPLRLKEQKDYFEGCRRFSDRDMLLMPGEEPNSTLGGHYTMVMSRPVYWTMQRNAGQPLVEEVAGYGKVYHIGSQADEMEMLRREGGYIWQSHARTKGSTGYPDASRETEYFRSEFFLGAAFQSLPVDQSEKRLCEERCFGTLDDMNNWTGAKYLVAEGDTYMKYPDDETYPHMMVNYVKLDRLPRFDQDWSPVLKAMRAGAFFVTSGEVLFRDWSVEGSGAKRTYSAEVEWTYPLEFVELVWGDGDKVERQVISATDTAAFGSKRFRVPFEAAGKKWVRFAVWDSAGNGAFTQPVHLR